MERISWFCLYSMETGEYIHYIRTVCVQSISRCGEYWISSYVHLYNMESKSRYVWRGYQDMKREDIKVFDGEDIKI